MWIPPERKKLPKKEKEPEKELLYELKAFSRIFEASSGAWESFKEA
jgi:hypothetical protein